ncbi:CRISPR-associated protein Csx19 [Campylobacter sp. MG1]|uniref:type III-D CRISPR-associated protein Csx19 n=1 Tax=Campylobacter sp. MG1 TaxID=2976332 RepID=UPI00226C8F32|nr:CRISPR-associated protein Csx19 [Campylobacter sp. MG1]
MKELLKDFDNAKIIAWTKDKVLFGKVKNGEMEFQSGISTLNKDEILEFRAFDGVKELYFWGDNSRLYEFKGDEINSTTIMLGKVVDCENGWSKVDDGRGGKFYLPLERQKDNEIIIEKYDIIGYHEDTNQAYIKGYVIKEIR